MAFPVFQFDQSAFPLLTPQQTSPFGGVLSDAIAKRLAMAKAQEAEAEVPYAGLSKVADILSKGAYSAAVLPQVAQKAAANPNVWANITNQQQQGLANIAAQPATGAGSLTGGSFISPVLNKALEIYQQQNQPKPSGNIFSSIYDYLTGGSSQQSQAAATQNAQPVEAYSQPVAPVNQAGTPPVNSGQAPQQGQTPTQKVGEYKKYISKEEETGKEQAKQQAEYGPMAQGVIQQDRIIGTLRSYYNDPFISKALSVPYGNKGSLAWYAQTGNKQEKEKIGNLNAAENNLISASFNLFPRLTDKDMLYLQQYKPSENDTADVRIGKINEIQNYVQYRVKQIKKADEYMSQGMSQAQAEFKAADDIAKEENSYVPQEPKKEKNFYAQTPEEFHSGKQAEATKMVGNKRMIKLGGKWYQED